MPPTPSRPPRSLTFYAYNGPYNVGGLRFIQTGDHDGDWEHITAR